MGSPLPLLSLRRLGSVALLLVPLSMPVQAAPVLIQLQCRLAAGPWQPCRMEVEQVGSHWWLLVGKRRIEFRHDGMGTVTMQGLPAPGSSFPGWRPVSSRWEDTSLCWDGICARGPIPLD
ncbi:MAG: hypothetical protein ACK5FE_02640 [Cyanobacteriota bacterium]